jgi:carbonic anhydrase/acetyltransferase-like protein (isoleucine patch superfamily)
VPVYALGDLIPEIQPEAYVHPDAVVIGAVTIGSEASIWPGAGALIPEDTEIPAGSMALGVPARLRPLDPGQQKKWIDYAVREYRDNARRYRRQLRRMD